MAIKKNKHQALKDSHRDSIKKLDDSLSGLDRVCQSGHTPDHQFESVSYYEWYRGKFLK